MPLTNTAFIVDKDQDHISQTQQNATVLIITSDIKTDVMKNLFRISSHLFEPNGNSTVALFSFDELCCGRTGDCDSDEHMLNTLNE